MVCPNCKSDEIISVQNQHFCINCGQMVPEALYAKAAAAAAPPPTPATPAVKVQPNGLPEGVEILPLQPVTKVRPEAKATAAELVTPVAADAPSLSGLIHGRSRFSAPAAPTPTVAKRRKPGRPKAGRLDVPSSIIPASPAERAAVMAKEVIAPPATVIPPASTAPAAARPAAKMPRSPLPPATAGPRRLSDIAPRRPSAPQPAPDTAVTAISPTDRAASGRRHHAEKPLKPKKTARNLRHSHRVGVPALHYQPVLSYSLRSRLHPHFLALAAAGALSLGVVGAYGAWQFLHGGVPALAAGLIQAGPNLLGEALVLALVYYIGRSIGQAAIVYGISREADQRPVTISRQFGVAVNTFGRRLRLDTGFALAELFIISAGAILFYSGGNPWPVDSNFQLGSIFLSYLALLYLWIAVALARGLASVNLTLTESRPGAAALIGWQLFSHRLELIGPRFAAILMESALALPLLGLVVALMLATPSPWHPAAIVLAGLLSWLAGTLLGVGTASWWAMLYRQLVTADRPQSAMALLSSRQPEDARRLPLALIIAASTFIVSAGLILPWLSLFRS